MCISLIISLALSKWCISHRKRAKQIVETWEKCFNSSQREKRISLLYLANDILQNSRRKGSEFVNEFWKVLPTALKHVYENGDEHGKKVATRLVSTLLLWTLSSWLMFLFFRNLELLNLEVYVWFNTVAWHFRRSSSFSYNYLILPFANQYIVSFL